jgi:hypothetical protein
LDKDPAYGGWDPFLYVLYGHTHTAAQIPVENTENNEARVYLNTGTWRPHARQGINKKGFLTWKNLTYTILYHPDHDPNSPAAKAGYPTFETWTGSLLEVPKPLRPDAACDPTDGTA